MECRPGIYTPPPETDRRVPWSALGGGISANPPPRGTWAWRHCGDTPYPHGFASGAYRKRRHSHNHSWKTRVDQSVYKSSVPRKVELFRFLLKVSDARVSRSPGSVTLSLSPYLLKQHKNQLKSRLFLRIKSRDG